ncbi:hypothetical protein [Roseibium sp. RKSG952]|uniref:hypothetical protein n=1 Tax=Roseibium sp. RKSG952 TaxID=2529384 RepID=UPI0012BCCBE3|nr:hypothetical protein [Roseibium sp. RKSG952]MTI00649.1 hypothetical protein [Roseibium sp. RKSG952]
MSAGGENTAIVSLGMSCQSARQIRTSIDVLSAALGEQVKPNRSFFDGLIAPIGGMCRLFEDGFPIFSREQILPGPGEPTWQPYGIRFLHHFRDEAGTADVLVHFEENLSRFSYLRQKFLRLRDRARVIFVVSNTQNNLPDVAQKTDIPAIAFSDRELERLQRAVDGFMGRSCEYLIVSYPSRYKGRSLPDLHLLAPDDSEWTGDKTQWRALFKRYFGQTSVMPVAV